jgi:hypothetical protein
MASGHGPGEVTWVGVPGGRLAVEVFGSETEPVLAIHGISSLIAEALAPETLAPETLS